MVAGFVMGLHAKACREACCHSVGDKAILRAALREGNRAPFLKEMVA